MRVEEKERDDRLDLEGARYKHTAILIHSLYKYRITLLL